MTASATPENYTEGRDHARIKESAEWVGFTRRKRKLSAPSGCGPYSHCCLSDRTTSGLKVYVCPDRENASLCPSDGERPTAINVEENSVPAVIAFHDRHVIKMGRFVHGAYDAI